MTSRLRSLVVAARRPVQPPDSCDLCAAPLPANHRHLLDRSDHQLHCVCQACRLLFDRDAAGGDHYQLVPERRLTLDAAAVADDVWVRLGVPVGLAALVPQPSGAALALYPSPAGPTESEVEAADWAQLVEAVPQLADIVPGVEALLVNRLDGARECWLVPLDDCYRLVALFRTHWQGMHGGDAVWDEVHRYLDALRRGAAPGDLTDRTKEVLA